MVLKSADDRPPLVPATRSREPSGDRADPANRSRSPPWSLVATQTTSPGAARAEEATKTSRPAVRRTAIDRPCRPATLPPNTSRSELPKPTTERRGFPAHSPHSGATRELHASADDIDAANGLLGLAATTSSTPRGSDPERLSMSSWAIANHASRPQQQTTEIGAVGVDAPTCAVRRRRFLNHRPSYAAS
jgi:hypothetical protein